MTRKSTSLVSSFLNLPEKQIDDLNEEQILKVLSESIAAMLESQPDLLLSSLYRMDVSEKKVSMVLESHSEEDIPYGLARLVLERQRTALNTRLKFPQKKIDDPEADF
nr:hypothetical protein [Saprospiraceae bacterium]